MSLDLEKDVYEIKISVARIEERLKIFEAHVITSQEHDKRLRVLEEYKAKLMGMCAGIGALAGTIAAVIVKLL